MWELTWTVIGITLVSRISEPARLIFRPNLFHQGSLIRDRLAYWFSSNSLRKYSNIDRKRAKINVFADMKLPETEWRQRRTKYEGARSLAERTYQQ